MAKQLNIHSFFKKTNNVASNDQDFFNLPPDSNIAVAATNAIVVNVLKASSSLLASDVLHVDRTRFTLSYYFVIFTSSINKR